MSASQQKRIDNFGNSYAEMFSEVLPLPKAKLYQQETNKQ